MAQFLSVVFVSLLLSYHHSLGMAALHFRSDGSFKVLQLTDLHYGEAEDLSWGPRQDFKSTRAIESLLKFESPDLVVFTGDQITGNNIHNNASAYWENLVKPCEDMGIRWAAVFGNHDTLPFEELAQNRCLRNCPVGSASSTSRRALMNFDMSHPLSFSADGQLPDGKTVSNFVLEITTNNSSSNVAARLYFFDTGGGDYEEVIYADQVSWFKNVSSGVAASAAASFAYFHIPLQEYATAWGRTGCIGMNENGGVTPVDSDSGLFDALVTAGVRATFVGHDHGNDWCCPSADDSRGRGFWMCFGRHSGYGGYGDWARGARVLNLRLSSSGVSASSWVRLESGKKLHSVMFDKVIDAIV